MIDSTTSKHLTINVVGLGYVGLPTALILAGSGYSVVGTDINPAIVNTLCNNNVHIQEEGLSELLYRANNKQLIQFSITPQPSDIFILCVPTPFKEDHRPDLSYLYKAVDSIIPLLQEHKLIIIESTVPIGTTEAVQDYILGHRADLSQKTLLMAHCPERVLPGNAVHEIVHNNRVIGANCPSSQKLTRKIYSSFSKGNIIFTDCRTAEFSKLAENTFRDLNIAYANELSILADHVGVDISKLIHICNMHPRVNIHKPGPGVGGHCIPVDPWFLLDVAQYRSNLILAGRAANLFKEDWVVQKILRAADVNRTTNIVLAGLAYKPDVDDFRESPSLRIAKKLHSETRIPISLTDPYAESLMTSELYGMPITAELFANEHTLVVLLVNHSAYNHLHSSENNPISFPILDLSS